MVCLRMMIYDNAPFTTSMLFWKLKIMKVRFFLSLSLSLSAAISWNETARGRGEHAVTKHYIQLFGFAQKSGTKPKFSNVFKVWTL